MRLATLIAILAASSTGLFVGLVIGTGGLSGEAKIAVGFVAMFAGIAFLAMYLTGAYDKEKSSDKEKA